MDSVKLAVGIPSYSGIKNAVSIKNIKLPFEYIECLGHPVVAMARNYVLNDFMASNCTHLLSLDGDIHFHPDVVQELIDAKKDIIGIAYARRNIDGLNVRTFDKYENYKRGEPIKVLALPLGMMLLTKAPLARFISANPEHYYIHHGEKGYAFCECPLNRETRGLECDGYNFSSKMIAQGEDIWCRPDLAVNHAGKIEYLEKYFVQSDS